MSTPSPLGEWTGDLVQGMIPSRCDEIRRPGGHEHLRASSRAHDTRRSVNVQARVAPVGLHRLAGMDAHPHLDRPLGPLMLAKRPLSGHRTRNGRSGKRECEEEAVSLHPDLDPAVRTELPAQQPPMLVEGVDIALPTQLAQQPRRALNVREHHGHGAGRQRIGLGSVRPRRSPHPRQPVARPGRVPNALPNRRIGWIFRQRADNRNAAS